MTAISARSIPERNALVEAHLELVDSVVGCLYRRVLASGRAALRCDRDDLVQEGRLGLIHAAETFDDKRGADFRTWATTCIASRFRDFLRCDKDAQKCVPLDDNIAAPDEFADAENRVCTQQLIAALSPRQREAIELHYFGGHNKTEVARLMCISTARAGQLISNGLRAMRAAA